MSTPSTAESVHEFARLLLAVHREETGENGAMLIERMRRRRGADPESIAAAERAIAVIEQEGT